MGVFGLRLAYLQRCWHLSVLMMIPCVAHSAEISALNFTSVDGYIALRYLLDEQSVIAQGVTSREDIYPTFQQEYAINTNGYIYHPNMLNMKLGGSLLYDQSSYESLLGESESSSDLENYYARLDFLEKKPYPVSFYYERDNPSIYTGLAGRYIQENTKYGYDFSLLKPFSPVQITAGAFRQISFGEGQDQIVNDIREQANIRVYHSYGSGNHLQLSHQINRMDSESGSPNLPIIHRITTTETSNLDTRNYFGDARKIKLTNTLSYSTQDQYPVSDDVRFNPGLAWQHSESLSSFYRYSFARRSEENFDSEYKRLSVGVSNSGEKINSSLEVHGYDNEVTGSDTMVQGARYSLSYKKPLSSGHLQLSLIGSYDKNEQESNINQIQIYGEEIVFSGTGLISLQHDYINLTTVIVSNQDRTQVFIQDLDYRLVVIGPITQIQRLAGGNILDGQTVILDYTYQTGGTYQYDVQSQTLALSYVFERYYEVYLQYLDYQQELLEGNPTIPLNSIQRATAGVRVERPLTNGMVIGGDAELVTNDETVSPYEKRTYDAFIQMPLPRLTDMRVSLRRSLTDYDLSDEDSDLYGYLVRVTSQPWLKSTISFESSYEKDTGGTIDRMLRQNRMHISWRIRQLDIGFNAQQSIEQQGSIERERFSIKAVAKREF